MVHALHGSSSGMCAAPAAEAVEETVQPDHPQAQFAGNGGTTYYLSSSFSVEGEERVDPRFYSMGGTAAAAAASRRTKKKEEDLVASHDSFLLPSIPIVLPSSGTTRTYFYKYY